MRKRDLVKTILAALGLMTVGTGGLWLLFGAAPHSYSSYSVPVLPMTSLLEAEGVTVERHLELDLSPYETRPNLWIDHEKLLVKDVYQLTNTTEEAVSMQLACPFAGRLSDRAEEHPAITVEGKKVNGDLYASVDMEESAHKADNWKEFAAAYRETNFLEEALGEVPDWEEKAIVYSFSDFACGDINAKTGKLAFQVDYTQDYEKSSVWSYGAIYRSINEEEGTGAAAFHVYGEDTSWALPRGWLIVLGEDIRDVTFQGYEDPWSGDETLREDITAEVDRYETTMTEAVWMLAEEYSRTGDRANYKSFELATAERLYDGAMKRLWQDTQRESDRYWDMDTVFRDVVSDRRMLYTVFEVEIGPGETISVEAEYLHEGSLHTSKRHTDWSGYDIAATLGSNLNFTVQTASVKGDFPFIRQVKQNWEPGASLEKEVYHLDVQRKTT